MARDSWVWWRRVVPPDPCRNPDLGSVDHFQHHAPVELCDHPASRAASKAITGLAITH